MARRGFVAAEHVHPHREERFQAVAGTPHDDRYGRRFDHTFEVVEHDPSRRAAIRSAAWPFMVTGG